MGVTWRVGAPVALVLVVFATVGVLYSEEWVAEKECEGSCGASSLSEESQRSTPRPQTPGSGSSNSTPRPQNPGSGSSNSTPRPQNPGSGSSNSTPRPQTPGSGSSNSTPRPEVPEHHAYNYSAVAMHGDDTAVLGNLDRPHRYCAPIQPGSPLDFVHNNLTERDLVITVEVPKATSTFFADYLNVFACKCPRKFKVSTRAGGRSKTACDLYLRTGRFHDPLNLMLQQLFVRHMKYNRVIPLMFLREPVTRVLSEYREWKQAGSWHDGGFLQFSKSMHPNLTLEEWLLHPDCPAHNRHTWMLTRVGPDHGDLRVFRDTWKSYYNDSEDYLSRMNQDNEMLEEAWRVIKEDHGYFGLSEFLHESLELFMYTFDLVSKTPTYALGHKGSKRKGEEPPSHIVQIVEERNRLDIELYERALEEFHRRVDAMHECEPDHTLHEESIHRRMSSRKKKGSGGAPPRKRT